MYVTVVVDNIGVVDRVVDVVVAYTIILVLPYALAEML